MAQAENRRVAPWTAGWFGASRGGFSGPGRRIATVRLGPLWTQVCEPGCPVEPARLRVVGVSIRLNFPSGVSHFREAPLDELDGKIGGFERVLREFQHELPGEVVAAFLGRPTNLECAAAPLPAASGHAHDPLPEGAGAIARFRHARNAQLGAQGLLAEARAQVALRRAELENRLYKNLLHAIDAVQGQPEPRRIAAQRLFPQHYFGDYLRNNRRRSGAERRARAGRSQTLRTERKAKGQRRRKPKP